MTEIPLFYGSPHIGSELVKTNESPVRIRKITTGPLGARSIATRKASTVYQPKFGNKPISIRELLTVPSDLHSPFYRSVGHWAPRGPAQRATGDTASSDTIQ